MHTNGLEKLQIYMVPDQTQVLLCRLSVSLSFFAVMIFNVYSVLAQKLLS